MPSIRSLLAGIAITSITLLQSTSAAPTPAPPCDEPTTTLALPVNGGSTELPASNGTLAYIAIGRGIQNYTCSAIGEKPVAIGAIANLYDATALSKKDLKKVHAIPLNAAYKPTPRGTSKLLDLPYIGHHFFDSAGTPVFTLTASKTNPKPIVFVAKTAGITAPATADKGPAKTAAVDWLLLDEKKVAPYTGQSVGINQVYRVVTVGGGGGACEKVGVKSVEYATEYWFYK